MTRNLSPYEKSHLAQYGKLTSFSEDKYGQMPVEYITGFVNFCEQEFIVNQQVLIPRVETEELIKFLQADLRKIISQQSNSQNNHDLIIADVGTGSGAIGLILFLFLWKRKIPATIYLLDISRQALRVAQANLDQFKQEFAHYRLDFAPQVEILKSDLLLNTPNAPLDLIVANLPYVPSTVMDGLDESVKNYEPRLAVDGGPNGLKLINGLLSQAKAVLKPNGVVWLEVDYTHTGQELAAKNPAYSFTMFRDQFQQNRFIKAVLLS